MRGLRVSDSALHDLTWRECGPFLHWVAESRSPNGTQGQPVRGISVTVYFSEATYLDEPYARHSETTLRMFSPGGFKYFCLL